MNKTISLRLPSFAGRTLAVALFAGAGTLGLHAQNTVVADNTPPVNIFSISNTPNLDLAAAAGVNYSSSSSSSTDATDPIDAERLSLSSDASQPPPRRRYGRPRYNDSNHNPDGSNKYEFAIGGGLTGPVGNTYHYLNTGYAFQVGVGRNFSKMFGVMAQFDYDNFGFNGRTLYNQSNIEFGQQGVGLDGSSHVWAFSLNPKYNIMQGDTYGAYLVAGAGFYHKTANFTVPTTGYYCDYYYGCYQYAANATVDKYTSNAPGFSGGFGITFKPSRFAGERFFAEARYVFMDNQQRTYATPNDYYPANSNRTTFTDYKAGIRF